MERLLKALLVLAVLPAKNRLAVAALPGFERDLIGYSERPLGRQTIGATSAQHAESGSRPHGPKVCVWAASGGRTRILLLAHRSLPPRTCQPCTGVAELKPAACDAGPILQPAHLPV
jgi:hypothetical protein